MSVVAELAGRAKIADPKPAFCCVCLCSAGPDVRFVDFGARRDVGTIVDAASNGLLYRLDKVEICEACLREAAECLDYRPSLHALHIRAVKERDQQVWELQRQVDHLRALVPMDLAAQLEAAQARIREFEQGLAARETTA